MDSTYICGTWFSPRGTSFLLFADPSKRVQGAYGYIGYLGVIGLSAYIALQLIGVF